MTSSEPGSVGIVQTQYFTFAEPPNELELECGRKLGPITLAYETYGEMNAEKSNCILICHALSGDAHVAGIAVGNPEAQTLAKRASTAWANFARNGKPSAKGLPDWPEYSLDKRETMILCATPHVESDPLGKDRLLRKRLAIDSI